MNNKIKDDIIQLRKQGKSYKEIRKTLGCSLSTISYHCNKNELSDHNKLREPSNDEKKQFQILYNEHLSTLKVSKITGWSKATVLKYVTTIKRDKMSDEEYRKNKVKSVVNWRKRTKEKLIEYKGGKCEKCGYNKCSDALEFHHNNPNEKDFGISTRGDIKSFEALKKEVDKCTLLCSNCHRELHFNLKQDKI